MSIKIYPIQAGEMIFPASALYDPTDSTPVPIPILAFYIEGAGKKILVDTGACDPSSERAKLHTPTYTQTPEQRIDVALKNATGVDAKDIDIVLLTHLHWDHAQGLDYFENAEFWVRMSEVTDSVNPDKKYVNTYEAFSGGYLPIWASKPRKWHFIEGTDDVDVLPGIKLISLPGHSIGLQGVLIETDQGNYLLPSDSIMQKVQLNEETKTIKPCPTCYLPELNKNTIAKIEELYKQGTAIIPSHDLSVLDHKYYPYE